MCTEFTDYFFLWNIFRGAWDGLIAPVVAVVSIFWDVEIYHNACERSRFYDFSFLFGIGLSTVFGINNFNTAIVAFIILLIIFILSLLFQPIIWGVGLVIGGLIAYELYKKLKGD